MWDLSPLKCIFLSSDMGHLKISEFYQATGMKHPLPSHSLSASIFKITQGYPLKICQMTPYFCSKFSNGFHR